MNQDQSQQIQTLKQKINELEQQLAQERENHQAETDELKCCLEEHTEMFQRLKNKACQQSIKIEEITQKLEHYKDKENELEKLKLAYNQEVYDKHRTNQLLMQKNEKLQKLIKQCETLQSMASKNNEEKEMEINKWKCRCEKLLQVSQSYKMTLKLLEQENNELKQKIQN